MSRRLDSPACVFVSAFLIAAGYKKPKKKKKKKTPRVFIPQRSEEKQFKALRVERIAVVSQVEFERDI